MLLSILNGVIYFAMLSVACYFIYWGEVLHRFHNRRTNYAVFEEEIMELPTILTYPTNNSLKYNKDFAISYHEGKTFSWRKTTVLDFGENTLKNGLKVSFEKLAVLPCLKEVCPHIYKVTPLNYKPEMPRDYILSYSFLTMSPAQVKLSLSTEYGFLSCDSSRFHDGEVWSLTLFNSVVFSQLRISV